MSAVVLAAVEHELARQEWQERFTRRRATKLGVSAAELLEQDRHVRRAHLDQTASACSGYDNSVRPESLSIICRAVR